MKVKFLSIFSCVWFALTAVALADVKTEFIDHYLAKKQSNGSDRFLQESKSSGLNGGIYRQKLNHDDPNDTRTFNQRFFYNSSYALNSDSPVLYFICGEGTCDENQLGRKSLLTFAQVLGAHLITVEHRYYGQTQPFTSLTTENLKYLSTDYALKDLAAVQAYATQGLEMRGKWIVIGGSYSGSLAAYYRLKYPDNVVGALASSAPVQAKANFEEYDLHVAKVTGAECGSKIREVVKQIEERLSDSQRAKEIKALFDAADVRDDVDFLYVVADMAAFAIQYGFTKTFCDGLNVADTVEGYAKVGKEMFSRFGMTPFMDSFQAAENLDPFAFQDFALRQWMYQSCTEYGYYQVSYHDPLVSVRSNRIDLQYHNEVCKRLFGFEKTVDFEATNKIYYEPLLVPEIHNIFLTNGTTDPWTNLSITKENGNDVNPNLALHSLVGGSHCSDLSSSNSMAAQEARRKFLDLASGWLAGN